MEIIERPFENVVKDLLKDLFGQNSLLIIERDSNEIDSFRIKLRKRNFIIGPREIIGYLYIAPKMIQLNVYNKNYFDYLVKVMREVETKLTEVSLLNFKLEIKIVKRW